jgi:hypothetical protein
LIATAALLAIIGNASFFYHFWGFRQTDGIRHEVAIGDGLLVICGTGPYRFPDGGKTWYTYEKPIRSFAARRGDPNDEFSGEGVGFRIDRKYSIPGIEYTSGKFIPPFIWQHPIVPFAKTKVSFLLMFVVCAAYPAMRFWLSWRRSNRQVHSGCESPPFG